MQIVIDIPEELYNNIQKGCGIYPYRLVYEAMKSGTPLPKGPEQALEAAKIIKGYCNSFPLMSCKDCVFDRSTGCALKNPVDFPETWDL